MSRRLKIFLYTSFAVLSVFTSALLTFPYAALGRRLETAAAQAMPGATLVINRLGPALPFGIKLADITFTLPATEGQPATSIQIDHIRLTPAWLKLLTFKPAVAFSVGALGGEATGQASMGKDTRHVDVKIDPSKALQLEDGGTLEKLLGVQLQGAVSGKISVNIDQKGTITSGNIDAQIDGAHLKSGKVMGFPLPATDFGTPEFAMTIEKGEGKIDKLKMKSSDVEGAVNGAINFAPDLAQSRIHGNFKIKLSDGWFARNPTLRQLISLAGPFRKPDGSLELPLNGPLARPVNLPGMGGFGRF